MIAEFLGSCGDYAVTVVDRSQAQLERLETSVPIMKTALDITQGDALRKVLAGKFAVLSAAPYHATRLIAEAAKSGGAHYLDLTEDVASTRAVKQLSAGARTASFHSAAWRPDSSRSWPPIWRRASMNSTMCACASARCRIPVQRAQLQFDLEHRRGDQRVLRTVRSHRHGQLRETQPLEELEEFSLDGILYEAFNTSGGLGTLCETLAGKVRNLNYRTIRYPGHAAIMKALLNDLRLRDRRELLKDILENAVPITLQDVVIVFVTVSGMRAGQLMQETYANKIYAAPMGGRVRSAIQITTAGGICAVLDMLSAGEIPQSGLIRQEEISLKAFLANRFGKVYAMGAPAAAHAA